MVVDLIVLIIIGAIIGLLGKLVAPGDKDNIPIWLTILCGIGGVLLGYWIYALFGGDGSGGIDWVRWFVAVHDRGRPGRDRLDGHRPQHRVPHAGLTRTHHRTRPRIRRMRGLVASAAGLRPPGRAGPSGRCAARSAG